MLRARLRTFLLVAVSSTSAMLAVRDASAQGASKGADAESEALDAEGTALLERRDLGAACPKLEKSYRLKPGTGVLLRLGLCHELAGRSASAWSAYRGAEALARATGDVSVAVLGGKRATALETKVAHLTVRVATGGEDAAGVEVTRDGVLLAPSSLAVRLPVDPGPHRIEARAPGYVHYATTVTVAPAGGEYDVTVPLTRDPSTAAAGPSVAGTGGPAPAPAADGGLPPQRVTALVVGGAGLATVGAASALGLVAIGKMNDARAACPAGLASCTPEGQSARDASHGAAAASTVAFGVGAAAIAAGAYLWLSAPISTSDGPRGNVRVAPRVGAGGTGLWVEGTW